MTLCVKFLFAFREFLCEIYGGANERRTLRTVNRRQNHGRRECEQEHENYDSSSPCSSRKVKEDSGRRKREKRGSRPRK